VLVGKVTSGEQSIVERKFKSRGVIRIPRRGWHIKAAGGALDTLKGGEKVGGGGRGIRFAGGGGEIIGLGKKPDAQRLQEEKGK